MQTEKDARLVELILQESNDVLRTRPGTIIVEHKLGFICANAGIDHSNVAGMAMQPKKWYCFCQRTRIFPLRYPPKLESITGKRIGVMIIDSHGRAWRNGTVGMSIGLSGFPEFLMNVVGRIYLAIPLRSPSSV